MRQVRVYADTSVFGGVFDKDYAVASRQFFLDVEEEKFRLVISPLIRDEIITAPLPIRDLFAQFRPVAAHVDIGPEVTALQQAYIRARIVSPKWEADALHVALATVSGCSAIVSWNFKHIVNFRRIPMYNGVNQSFGYGQLAIHTPQEMCS